MKGTIKINSRRCKGCAYCIDACHKGVIVIRKRFNKSGYFPAVPLYLEKCTGCAMCATVCPEIAIEVYSNNKKKGRF
jgi:2-oxoglutarate ferredoxin oxidoreductase subunit delta